MDGAEKKDVVDEQQRKARTRKRSKAGGGTCSILEREIVKEVRRRPAEVAKALVDAAANGQHPSFKTLLEVLQRWEDERATEAKGIERSLASGWEVEPEWRDGCCAICGRADGLRLELAA